MWLSATLLAATLPFGGDAAATNQAAAGAPASTAIVTSTDPRYEDGRLQMEVTVREFDEFVVVSSSSGSSVGSSTALRRLDRGGGCRR